MVVKDQHILLVAKYVEADQPGCFSVYFDRPESFTFDAGDWIDIHFNARNLNGGITYSISSSPTEGEIRITFREGISEFKKALLLVQPGGQRVRRMIRRSEYDTKLFHLGHGCKLCLQSLN